MAYRCACDMRTCIYVCIWMAGINWRARSQVHFHTGTAALSYGQARARLKPRPPRSSPTCVHAPPRERPEAAVQPVRHALGRHQPAGAVDHAHMLDPRPPVRRLLLALSNRVDGRCKCIIMCGCDGGAFMIILPPSSPHAVYTSLQCFFRPTLMCSKGANARLCRNPAQQPARNSCQ